MKVQTETIQCVIILKEGRASQKNYISLVAKPVNLYNTKVYFCLYKCMQVCISCFPKQNVDITILKFF